jgi:hypothetical protein
MARLSRARHFFAVLRNGLAKVSRETMMRRKIAGSVICLVIAGIATAKAQTPAPATQTTTPSAPASAEPADQLPPGLWIDGIHLSAQFDVGILGNPSGPADGLNFGHLFTDHANQVQLNQLLLTANKPLDPKNSDYQWGFKVQFMYGSDARYTQFLGELNRVDPN